MFTGYGFARKGSGMDRNLERNLARVGAMRDKGDHAKARRKLTDLVQDHPDTPAYRLELARVCLALGDTLAGLSEVRTLLRQYPDERPDALAAVVEHFDATSSLPCAQFLYEDHLARDEHDEVALVLERLTEPQLQQAIERYATKIASLEKHPETGASADPATNATLRLALWASFHCALALKAQDAAAGHACRLLRTSEDERRTLLTLLERLSRTQQLAPVLLTVLGEARLREGRSLEGLSVLLSAAERDRALAARVQAIVEEAMPLIAEKPAVLRTRGHLARLQGRHDEAVALYREAIALDPQGASSLLQLLAPALKSEGPEARLYALLRIELLARSGDGAALASALDDLRDRLGLAPDKLREVLAPHLGPDAPPTLHAAAGLLAVQGDDHEELARILAAGPPLNHLHGRPLVRALEQRLGLDAAKPELVIDPATGEVVTAPPTTARAPRRDEPAPARRHWLHCLVRLHAAAGDTAGANARLELLWREAQGLSEQEHADLLALTRATYTTIAPTPSALAALLGPLASHGGTPHFGTWLVAAAAADPAGLTELGDALIDAASLDVGHARVLGQALALLDGPARDALAWPATAARLFGGDEEGALRELDAIAAASADGEGRALRLLLAYGEQRPPRTDVALAAARLLRMDDQLDQAIAVVCPALEHDPRHADEAALFFESVLADEPERADVWLAYLDGLLRAGHWQRLTQVLPRAEQALPAAEIGRLRGYRARLLYEEGDLNGALQESELALQLADPPLGLLTDLLQAILTVKPGLARAHKLLGDAARAAGRLDDALRAHGQALRCDPSLQSEILHATRRATAQRQLGGEDCLALARFYLDAGRGDEAVRAYNETLQLTPDRASEVAGDLGDYLDGAGPFPALLQPLTQALRLTGRTEDTERACTALYAHDPSRADWIFKELALLEAARPDEVGPVRARARILLAEKRAEDLERLIGAALERLAGLPASWELTREFAAVIRGETMLVLAASAAAGAGHRAQAWEWLDQWTTAAATPSREYVRACAVLESLGGDDLSWPRRDVMHRVHLRGKRPDLALAALPAPGELAPGDLDAAWKALEALRPLLGDEPAVHLQRARYLHARGEAEAALAELATIGGEGDTAVASDLGPDEAALRRETLTLRGLLLTELGRHDEARRTMQDLPRAPGPRAEALDPLRQARPDEALRQLAQPCEEPAQEQTRRLAQAELLVLLGRPLEAAERLRTMPLSGTACLLPDAQRERALWLLAHGEECRGAWAQACACYRLLAQLSEDEERVRSWHNWSYGRLLEQTVETTPLVLEKTAVLV